LVKRGPAAHDEIARVWIDWIFSLDPTTGVPDEFNVEYARETASDFALRFRDVRAIGFEPVGPDMGTTFGVDELRVYADLVTRSPHATFEDIAHAEFTPDLLCVSGFSLVGKSGVAGENEAAGNP